MLNATETDPVVVMMLKADEFMASPDLEDEYSSIESALKLYREISNTTPTTVSGALDELYLALDSLEQFQEPDGASAVAITSGCIKRVISFLDAFFTKPAANA